VKVNFPAFNSTHLSGPGEALSPETQWLTQASPEGGRAHLLRK
jgi:hypothetical protein